jgi:tRNA-specific 2-thiouridylase
MSSAGGRRVVVAMSGGVDSSVAAALLVEQGYEVSGVMMRLWAEGNGAEMSANRCCTPAAVADAHAVTRMLGIPFHLLCYGEIFKARVVDYFVAGYARGLTPNPCLACNRHVRFGRLLAEAQAMGADYLATGHYARVRRQGDSYQLLRGIDAAKDQSYVLYMLNQAQLSQVLFPLGDYTKEEVRAMARARGLPVADKAESQDLCFLADGDYKAFLKRVIPAAVRPGPILDRSGRVIGQHKGLPYYTIGQRQGLGIAAPRPLYVLEIDVEHNALKVGQEEELGRKELIAEEMSYVAGRPPAGAVAITAKIRYRAQETPATLIPLNGERAALSFASPQRDITPGQGVVLYQGDVVLGGGIISAGPFPDEPAPS